MQFSALVAADWLQITDLQYGKEVKNIKVERLDIVIMGVKSDTKEAILLSKIAREAALEAVAAYDKKKTEKKKKTTFHNTGLLMNNYLDFIEHYEKIKCNASDSLDDLDELETEIVEQDDVIIYSIKRSKIKTKIMIHQIETAIALVKNKMTIRGEPEKFEVIELMYMDPSKKDMKFHERVKLVSDQLNCGESTVRRWNNEMMDEISKKLFGYDALRIEV